MTTDTPTPTETTDLADKATMLASYDRYLQDLFAFTFTRLDEFDAKMSGIESMCEDPLGRAAIEGLVTSVREGSFKDGKDGERAMIVVDQRFIDSVLDLRGVLAA